MKLFNCGLVILFFALITLTACKEDEGEETLILPSNLVVSITEDPDTKGLITVTASADKTNYYSFLFTESTGTTVIESNTGIETYQYTETGNFTVTVRAHLRADKYIEESEEITIQGSSTGNGEPPATGYSTPLSYPNYTLIWNDEFDGTALNTADWNYEIGTGNGGWGNNELQYYLEDNTSVRDGILTITAKNDFFNGSNYTSSRITTENKQSFQYGRIDIRAAVAYGQGIWPALWMLGANFRMNNWPSCGEIDIMEMVGGTTTSNRGDGVVHGTAHWSNDGGGHAEYNGNKKLVSGKLADEFHVYSIIWDSQKITWYIDDQRFHELDITPAALSEFHQKFFFIFNIAVGGNWPGSPNSTTTFPQKMYVDYVRVFQ